ncbi:unnamed protein product [marine sediment metagenome]|uniref:Uncharacterized protein n=1 Tax=marine sediment metagenome TaxID=412755 RepID=X0Z969_9ZZZZ
MQPEGKLAFWEDFDTEFFFLIYDYSAHTNCFVRADKPETAMKIYFKWKGIDNYANLFKKFYHDCNCHDTEVRPRMVQQMLSEEELRQLQRDNIVEIKKML